MRGVAHDRGLRRPLLLRSRLARLDAAGAPRSRGHSAGRADLQPRACRGRHLRSHSVGADGPRRAGDARTGLPRLRPPGRLAWSAGEPGRRVVRRGRGGATPGGSSSRERGICRLHAHGTGARARAFGHVGSRTLQGAGPRGRAHSAGAAGGWSRGCSEDEREAAALAALAGELGPLLARLVVAADESRVEATAALLEPLFGEAELPVVLTQADPAEILAPGSVALARWGSEFVRLAEERGVAVQPYAIPNPFERAPDRSLWETVDAAGCLP